MRRNRSNTVSRSALPAPATLAGAAAADEQLAIFTGMHGGHCFGEGEANAALRAVLHDAAVFLGRFDALAALENIVADRLLDIDVLAGLTGPNRDQRVPVIAGGDRNRVQLLVVEGLAHVLHGLG